MKEVEEIRCRWLVGWLAWLMQEIIDAGWVVCWLAWLVGWLGWLVGWLGKKSGPFDENHRKSEGPWKLCHF